MILNSPFIFWAICKFNQLIFVLKDQIFWEVHNFLCSTRFVTNFVANSEYLNFNSKTSYRDLSYFFSKGVLTLLCHTHKKIISYYLYITVAKDVKYQVQFERKLPHICTSSCHSCIEIITYLVLIFLAHCVPKKSEKEIIRWCLSKVHKIWEGHKE